MFFTTPELKPRYRVQFGVIPKKTFSWIYFSTGDQVNVLLAPTIGQMGDFGFIFNETPLELQSVIGLKTIWTFKTF